MNNALAVTELLMELLIQAQRISSFLQLAQAENRDLTENEWRDIVAENADARARLVAAINARRANT